MNPAMPSDGIVAIVWETPRSLGAVAIGRLSASSPAVMDALLLALTDGDAIQVGEIAHRPFRDIDDGLIARLSPSSALLMPHGGPRIVARIDAWLQSKGVIAHGDDDSDAAARAAYPEAASGLEARALAAVAHAASARAVPLLLAQPRRIADAHSAGWIQNAESVARGQRLARLIHPPRIVAVGAANVGKSSLLNAVAGRTVAIAMDFAGTTRDAVAGRVELDGLVVDWFDTPGIRSTDDEVECAAQALAGRLREGADLLLEISAPEMPCPTVDSDVARLKVCTRIDLDVQRTSQQAREATVCVSATDRTGLSELACAIRKALVFDSDLASTEPWIFHPALL